MPRRPRLLVVTRHTPLPWEDGAGAYLFDLLRHLRSEGFEPHVAWIAPYDHLRWRGIWTLPADFASVVALHTPGALRLGRRQLYPGTFWLPFKARALDLLKRALAALGLRVGRRQSASASPAASVPPPSPISGDTPPTTGWMAVPTAAEQAFVDRLIRRLGPTAVIANYAWMTPAFGSAAAPRPFLRLCLHADVAWQRAAQQAAVSGQPPAITSAVEGRLLQAAETIIAISDFDATALRALAPAARVLVAPKAVRPCPAPPSAGANLLFVGSGNSFNATGLAWFLAEVWPLLRAARPDVTLAVCGSVAGTVPDRPAGVTFHGPVDDLEIHYSRAALVIVPLLHATGLNIKLVDAAARARAIVTTPATLAGAPFLRDAVAAADTPAAFAQATLGLLADPAARAALAARALAAVEHHLNPATCYAALVAALRNP